MTSADRRLLQRADEQDARRRVQISNQVASINRLLKSQGVSNPEAASQEIELIQGKLAIEQRKVARVRELLAAQQLGQVLSPIAVKEALDADDEG